jgi:hypothetical protein
MGLPFLGVSQHIWLVTRERIQGKSNPKEKADQYKVHSPF